MTSSEASANIRYMKLSSKIESVCSIDHLASGNAARAQRKLHKLSLRDMGERMKVSAAYLCDLEKGRRNWSDELVERFNRALK